MWNGHFAEIEDFNLIILASEVYWELYGWYCFVLVVQLIEIANDPDNLVTVEVTQVTSFYLIWIKNITFSFYPC